MRRLYQEQGQGLVEYAFILVLVAILVIGVLLVMGPSIGTAFSNVVEALSPLGEAEPEHLSGVSGVYVAGTLTLSIEVAEATTLSFGGDVTGSHSCGGGTCTVDFPGAPAHGTVTITATDGSTRDYSW